MKILFYLPATTINWFNDSLVPLIRAAARSAEVHVIVAPWWNGTGITEDELAGCPDLEHVHWHILDSDDHPSFRTRPDDPQPVIDLVAEIAPDHTFCRSADVTTPAAFPGPVRFLMEGEFAPSLPASVPRGGRIVVTGPRFYDFGFVPALDDAQAQRLDRLAAPALDAIAAQRAQAADRSAYLRRVGLPDDRPIVAVPLQFQGSANVFGQVHGSEGPANLFVERLLSELGDGVLLALTVHPMDLREGIGEAIARLAALPADRVRIVQLPGEAYQGENTERLIQHCDGLVVAESKAISLGAWFGKPILRRSHFATADWVRAYRDAAAFRDALCQGTAVAAEPAAMRRWYAWHFANDAFVAAEASLADLLDRAERPLNPDRWERALQRHAGAG